MTEPARVSDRPRATSACCDAPLKRVGGPLDWGGASLHCQACGKECETIAPRVNAEREEWLYKTNSGPLAGATGRDICWLIDGLRDARAANVELAEALEACAQELYDSAHSSGDPSDPANMQSDAVVYRLARAALGRYSGGGR